ncbi:MAG: hypothetical protein AAFR09_10580, partial [Pseudomonadota bacterium]
MSAESGENPLDPLAETLEVALHPSFNLSAGDLVLRVAPGAGRSGGEVVSRDPETGALSFLVVPDDVETEHEAAELARAIRLSVLDANGETETTASNSDWVGQVKKLVDGKVDVEW